MPARRDHHARLHDLKPPASCPQAIGAEWIAHARPRPWHSASPNLARHSRPLAVAAYCQQHGAWPRCSLRSILPPRPMRLTWSVCRGQGYAIWITVRGTVAIMAPALRAVAFRPSVGIAVHGGAGNGSVAEATTSRCGRGSPATGPVDHSVAGRA